MGDQQPLLTQAACVRGTAEDGAYGTGLTSMNRTLREVNVAPEISGDYHPGAIVDLWDAFWTLYPRHEAKKDAQRAWSRMAEMDKVSAVIAIADWRQVWRAQGREIHTIPLPATWLNGERWEDEVPQGLGLRRIGENAGLRPAPQAGRTERSDTVDAGVTGLTSRERPALPPHVLEMIARMKEKL